MPDFNGFPRDAARFLTELSVHNDRAWFEANRRRYDDGLVEPARALVDALGPRLQAISPSVRYESKVNRSLFRIQRDTRFSADKRPYKEHLDVMFWCGDEHRNAAGYFLRITGAELVIGAGRHVMSPEQIARWRELVLDERGGAFIDAAAASARAAGFAISEPGYKRVPAGLPADHPRAGWLRQKDFNAFLRGPHPEELGQSAFVDWCAERLVHLAPVLAVTEGL